MLKPLPWYSPKSWYYGLCSLFLGTVGQLSDGIRTGYRYGFDSGMIMHYIYENKPGGKFYLGKKIDEAFLKQITCRAFRAVKEIQKNMILSYLAEREGMETFIADMASGEADYLYDVLRHTDLPQLAASISPRKVTLGGTVDAGNRRLSEEVVRAAYASANVTVRNDAPWDLTTFMQV